MNKTYTYQLNNTDEIFSSRIKAHKRLCNVLHKNENDFLPIKENFISGKINIIYPDGYVITKRLLQ